MEIFYGSKDRSAARQAYDHARILARRTLLPQLVLRSLTTKCEFGVQLESDATPVGWNPSGVVDSNGNVVPS